MFFVLFSVVEAHAQYGYGNNSGMGMNRTNNGMPNTQQTPKEPTPEEIEKNRNEKIQAHMLLLKKDLSLDELQYIAIKNEVTTNNYVYYDTDRLKKVESVSFFLFFVWGLRFVVGLRGCWKQSGSFGLRLFCSIATGRGLRFEVGLRLRMNFWGLLVPEG